MKRALEEYLVVCDLENALLDEQNNIPAVDRDVIRLLEERGGRFTVATDRSPKALSQALGGIKLTAPAICGSGTLIYDLYKEETLFSCALDHDAAQLALCELLAQFPQVGAAVQTTDENLRIVHSSGELREWVRSQKTGYYLEQSDDVPDNWQKVVFCGEASRIDFLEQYAKTRSFGDMLRILRQDHQTLTILPAKISRGTALLELARLCGTAPADIVYIGGCADAQEPMSLAGHTAAVKGAPPRVLLCADTVTAITGAEGGAAEYLYHWIRNHETKE